LLFLVAWLVFMVANMPAAFVVSRIPGLEPSLATAGLKLAAVEGTIWQGRAQVQYQNLDGIVVWHLDAWGLPRMQLPLEMHLETTAGDADLSVLLSRTEQNVRIPRADIDLAKLSPLFSKQRVKLDGRLMVLDLELMLIDQVVDYVAGQLSWSGGTIGYPVGRNVRERKLPEFKGLLSMKEDVAHFGLREVGGSFDVIEATLNKDGEAMARVKGHLFSLVEENLPGDYQPQDDVFKVKKKILPYGF
jgi:hypothetical protein